MQSRKQLLREIKTFARETGLATTTIGQYAVGNSKLVARLEAGGEVTSATIDEVRGYMAEERQKRAAKKAAVTRPLARACPA